MRKTNAGVKLAFIARLKKLEAAGISYAAVNEYLRSEMSSVGSSFGLSYISDMLTYDPRNDEAKTYAEAHQALLKIPASVDWSSLYGVVEGMDLE